MMLKHAALNFALVKKSYFKIRDFYSLLLYFVDFSPVSDEYCFYNFLWKNRAFLAKVEHQRHLYSVFLTGFSLAEFRMIMLASWAHDDRSMPLQTFFSLN